MEKFSRHKCVFSSSGMAPFKRLLEYEREFVRNELDKIGTIETLSWNKDMSLDDLKRSGYYVINGFRESLQDGMPIVNCGSDDNISAILLVNNGVGDSQGRNIVGQILLLSNRKGGETKLYTRSYNCLDETGEWTHWQVLQGITEMGICDSVDSCTDNGLYSGVLDDGDNMLTFVLVVINNYFAATIAGVDNSMSQIFYAVNIQGDVFLKQRSGNAVTGWNIWRNIISDENQGSVDLSDFEKYIKRNSEAINSETERAITAEGVINDKITQLDETVLRLLQKNFPLMVRVSYTPVPSVPNEYTGNSTEFTFYWSCSVDGNSVSANEIESVVLSFNGGNVTLPAGSTNYKIALSDTTTVTVTVTANGMKSSATSKVTFGHRWFSGMVAPDSTVDEALLSALSQQGIAAGKAINLTYSSFSLKKIVYAFAAKYGELSAIIDANNINLIKNYTLSKTTINGVEYNVYMTTEEFSVSGSVTYKFQ